MGSVENTLVSLTCILAVPWITVPANAIVAYTNWGNHWEKGGANANTRLALGVCGALVGLLVSKVAAAYCSGKKS
jgi:hypothetical protein